MTTIIAPQLAEVAQLVADPGRAKMLLLMMDGCEKSAGELAAIAGITPQTASTHLAKLVERALLIVEKRGPRRLYRLASPDVAYMLEGIMVVAVTGPQRYQPASKVEGDLRRARICYDHLAGRLGVELNDALLQAGHVVLDRDGGELTRSGREFLLALGLNIARESSQSTDCRQCLDWSERRPHLAGQLGAELADLSFRRGWIRRLNHHSCTVEITSDGMVAFTTLIGARI